MCYPATLQFNRSDRGAPPLTPKPGPQRWYTRCCLTKLSCQWKGAGRMCHAAGAGAAPLYAGFLLGVEARGANVDAVPLANLAICTISCTVSPMTWYWPGTRPNSGLRTRLSSCCEDLSAVGALVLASCSSAFTAETQHRVSSQTSCSTSSRAACGGSASQVMLPPCLGRSARLQLQRSPVQAERALLAVGEAMQHLVHYVAF